MANPNDDNRTLDPHGSDGDAIDVPFGVPARLRLRFTDDVLQRDVTVLRRLLTSDHGPPAALLACDSGVARTQLAELNTLRDSLAESGVSMPQGFVEVPGGEAGKNDAGVVDTLLAAIDSAGLDRQSYVIAIGGGATLDVVGYGAAIAHRGLRLVRVPTTTLSQGDSGVAVKNAVNRFGKKNWQGVFATPWAVINDRAVLQTLPDRDFAAGFSEAVKVALLKSPSLLDRVARDAGRLRGRDWDACGPVIRESALWHLDHITGGGDPFEQTTARPLDFGHWSAHRLETLSHFQLRHGEAVAIGVALDTAYSAMVHALDPNVAESVHRTLIELGLPVFDPLLTDAEPLLHGLEEFRQHLGGQLTVTMLEAVGRPIDVHEVDTSAMRGAIGQLKRVASAG
ncbi:MAG: 3-dehydroquinate synthase [Planctomycetota bacterium]